MQKAEFSHPTMRTTVLTRREIMKAGCLGGALEYPASSVSGSGSGRGERASSIVEPVRFINAGSVPLLPSRAARREAAAPTQSAPLRADPSKWGPGSGWVVWTACRSACAASRTSVHGHQHASRPSINSKELFAPTG